MTKSLKPNVSRANELNFAGFPAKMYNMSNQNDNQEYITDMNLSQSSLPYLASQGVKEQRAREGIKSLQNSNKLSQRQL